MNGINRFRGLFIVLMAAYLLSACSGMAVRSSNDTVSGGKALAKEVAFTGTVEAINSSEITVGGQIVSIDTTTVVDPNIKVGDIVKVEAQVSDSGIVLALKVESFSANDSIPTVSIDETSTPQAIQSPDSTSTPDPFVTQTANGLEKEIIGVVDAITATSVTIDGVEYQFSSFTEFNNAVFVGDTVKLHVIVNADGSLILREIQKTAGTGIGNDNSNNNGSGSDDDSNDDENDDNGGSNNSGSGSDG